MKENYFVYILIDPRNGIPFYVGKGTGARHTSHTKEYHKQIEYYTRLYQTPEKMLSLKHKIIHDLHYQNREYKYHLIKNLNEEDAYILEQALIAWFGRKLCGNGILTNLLSGGENGEVFFDDEQLVKVFQRRDLLDEILKFEKTSTKWVARTLYFHDSYNRGYPFTELKIDWLYNYHQCHQQFAIIVIEKLFEYDAVITPYYWVRKVQQNDYLDDNVYIMEESFEYMEGTNYRQSLVQDFQNFKNTYVEQLENKKVNRS